MCAGSWTGGMLLVLLFLFLMSELPPGRLGVISSLLGEDFVRYCYLPLGGLRDIVSDNKELNLYPETSIDDQFFFLGCFAQLSDQNLSKHCCLSSFGRHLRKPLVDTFCTRACMTRHLVL